MTDDMQVRYECADKVYAAAFPKGEAQTEWAIGRALLESLPADRDYKYIGLKQEVH